MIWIRRIIDRLRKRKPIDLDNRDRLFLYLDGELDAASETVDVEYLGTNMVKIRVTRLVLTQDHHCENLIDIGMKSLSINVALQFGASGRIMKTEGVIADLKISSDSDSSRMVYSILCEAKPFQ